MQTVEKTGIQSYGNLHCALWQQDAVSRDLIQATNTDEIYPAASLSKLYIVAAILSLAEHGQVDLYQPLKITQEEFRQGNYGTGPIRRNFALSYLASRWLGHELIPPIPIKELLYRAVHDSDNIAALKVTNEIGRDRIQGILQDWGLYETTIYNPQTDQPNNTTAENMGRFLLEFGRGMLVEDEQFYNLMLKWMKERKIPNQWGRETHVKYKNGQISQQGFGYVHSGGYLQGPQGQVFVVLTQDKVKSEQDSTYPQQERVRSTIEDMAYQVA